MNAPTLPWFERIQSQVAKLPSESDRAIGWRDTLVAVHFRVIYFVYHRDEFGRLIDEGLAHVPESEHDRALITAAFGEQDAQQLSVNAVLAEAQLIAAAQSLFAACEIFGRMAYWALGLDTTVLSLSLNDLTFQTIIKHAYGQTKAELDSLNESPEFQYLAAFVSANKFRHLLSARPCLTYADGIERGGLSIAAFHHGRGSATHDFPSKWASDFLTIDCEKIIERFNHIGNALAKDMV